MQFIAGSKSTFSQSDPWSNRPIFVAPTRVLPDRDWDAHLLDRPPPLEGLCRGASFATVGYPPSGATLDAPTGRFHRARLHHTGVLICRDFCLGLGRRGVGGRSDVPSWVAANPPAINSKIAVDRPGWVCVSVVGI
jgi:hypothetical protein